MRFCAGIANSNGVQRVRCEERGAAACDESYAALITTMRILSALALASTRVGEHVT